MTHSHLTKAGVEIMGIKERKVREKEARREDIIDAAEKIFFQKGVMVATMDEIAEAAELSKGTLYLYYKSKEDLYLAVCLRGMEIMHDLFLKATTTDEPVVKLIQNLGPAYLSYFKNHREYFRMFYFFEHPQLQSQVSPEMQELCSTSDRGIWAIVVGLIQKGIDTGVLHKDLDPMEASVMLWSNSNGLMRLMDRNDDQWVRKLSLDLESTLNKSNSFLVQSMLTEKGKKEYADMMLDHIHVDNT